MGGVINIEQESSKLKRTSINFQNGQIAEKGSSVQINVRQYIWKLQVQVELRITGSWRTNTSNTQSCATSKAINKFVFSRCKTCKTWLDPNYSTACTFVHTRYMTLGKVMPLPLL